MVEAALNLGGVFQDQDLSQKGGNQKHGLPEENFRSTRPKSVTSEEE